MEPVSAGSSIVLAVLLALSTAFNLGLTALDKKDYPKAITCFTEVYGKDVPGNTFRGLALFFRAQAYVGQGDKEKALADLVILLQTQPDAALQKDGRALYQQLGGDLKKLLPLEGPKAVWAKFITAAGKGDLAGMRATCTGPFLAKIEEEAKRGGNWAATLASDVSRTTVADEHIEQDKEGRVTSAVLLLKDARGDQEMPMRLDLVEGTWRLADARPDRGGAAPPPAALGQKNANKLKQIGLALLMYSGDNGGNFPASFKELVDNNLLAEGDVYLWTAPAGGKDERFLYFPGFKDDNDNATSVMVAAAPRATNGRREALFIDGHVEQLPEAEFQKRAKAQSAKIAPDAPVDPKAVPADLRAKVEPLVQQLGDTSADVRRAAHDKLKAMGATAFPALRLFEQAPDPEVRLSVKDLLDGK